MSLITDSAKSLARNPLGIIALFIVMIYGFASLVLTAGGASLQTTSERLPIIWFLTLFPVAVLGVFAWLVAYHNENLYAPGDYAKDESFLKAVGITMAPQKTSNGRKQRSPPPIKTPLPLPTTTQPC
jgi:hypothetical protein